MLFRSLAGDTTVVSGEDWKVSYDIGDSWDKVKKEKKKNSSLHLKLREIEIIVLYVRNNVCIVHKYHTPA